MRRLSLSDTIFYNLGDCYITSAFVLDGACDLAALLADIEGVIEAVPAMAEQPKRIGVWTFARKSGPVDLTAHVAILRDPSVVEVEQLVPRLERLRRSAIHMDGPPWRAFVLNPAGTAGVPGGQQPISALLIQIRHGLADATRGLQILSRMGRHQPTLRHRTLAGRLPEIDPAHLADEVRVHDTGLSLLQVPRQGMSREGEASERLAFAAATLVADESLFPHARPLRGNIGRTRLVRRRVLENGLGNHLKMVTLSTGAAVSRRRFRIPGLARAQDLQLTQWLVALSPRWLARTMMRIWYASFDALATLLPLPRHLVLGGRSVVAAFGIPPLWGPVPLVMIAMADGDHYNVTVIPGEGFTADRSLLLDRVHDLLNPAAAEAGLTVVAGAEAALAGDPRPQPVRRVRLPRDKAPREAVRAR